MGKSKQKFKFWKNIAKNWTSLDTVIGIGMGAVIMFILMQVYAGENIAPFILPILQFSLIIFGMRIMIFLASKRKRQDYPERLGGWDWWNMNLFNVIMGIVIIMMAASLAPQGADFLSGFKDVIPGIDSSN